MWFLVQDGIYDLPEVLRLPRRHRHAAVGAWTLCGGYVSKHLTNGFVPDDALETLGVTSLIRGHLVAAGLWVESERGGVEYMLVGCRLPDGQAATKARSGTARRVANLRARRGQSTDCVDDQAEYDGVTPLQDESSEGYSPRTRGEIRPNYVTNTLSSKAVVALSGTELAADDSFELATSERGLSAPVKVGASRLVATIIRRGLATDADRTILRLKASELLVTESEDDVADCLRLWLTKTELGAHGLPLCMAEVLKRKHNGNELRGADKKAAEWLALGKEHNDKR